MISPDTVFKQIADKPVFINSIQLISILEKPFYSINYSAAKEAKNIFENANRNDTKPDNKRRSPSSCR